MKDWLKSMFGWKESSGPVHLSKNFTCEEFVDSETARKKNIPNEMENWQFENAKCLAENVLQPTRDHFGPVIVTSGFRCPKLNKAIGGAEDSQHTKGEAADIEVSGVSTHDLFKWIKNNLKFDQLILEFYDSEHSDSGWVHVSYKREGKLRNELLMALKTGEEVEYQYYDENRI